MKKFTEMAEYWKIKEWRKKYDSMAVSALL